MESFECFGIRISVGQAAPPTPDNENRHLLPDWMTPAEAMQWVRQRKERLSRERENDASLWACPEHCRKWAETLGIEKMILRQCYGVREA